MKFKFPKFSLRKPKEKVKSESIKDMLKSESRKFVIAQLCIFFTYIVCFIVFLTMYVVQLSEIVYDMNYNSKLAQTQVAGQIVVDYQIKTNGDVGGTLVDGSPFHTTADKMVLASSLGTTDEIAIITPDKTLLCEPNNSFILNMLIGSKMILVLVTSTALSIIVATSKKKEKLIFNRNKYIRWLLLRMPVLVYIFTSLTYIVVA